MAFKVVNGKIIDEKTEQIIDPGKDYQKVLNHLEGKKFLKVEKTRDGFKLIFDSGLSNFIGNIVKILSKDEKISLNILKNKLHISLKAEEKRLQGHIEIKTNDDTTETEATVVEEESTKQNSTDQETEKTSKTEKTEDSKSENDEREDNEKKPEYKTLNIVLDKDNKYVKIDSSYTKVVVDFDDKNYWVLLSTGKEKSSIKHSGETVVLEKIDVPVSFRLVSRKRERHKK